MGIYMVIIVTVPPAIHGQLDEVHCRRYGVQKNIGFVGYYQSSELVIYSFLL